MPDIPNYSKPQTRIFQILRDTPAAIIDRQHAIVVGPQYRLEYPETEELSAVSSQYLTPSTTPVPYRVGGEDAGALLDLTTHEVDIDSVRLFADEMEALVYEFGDPLAGPPVIAEIFETSPSEGTNVVRTPSGFGHIATDIFQYDGNGPPPFLDPSLSNRPIRVGDRIKFSRDEGGQPVDYTRNVIEILGAVSDATVAATTAGTNNAAVNASNQSLHLSSPSYVDDVNPTISAFITGFDLSDFYTSGTKVALDASTQLLGDDITVEVTTAGPPVDQPGPPIFGTEPGAAIARITYSDGTTADIAPGYDDSTPGSEVVIINLVRYGMTLSFPADAGITTFNEGDSFHFRVFPTYAGMDVVGATVTGPNATAVETTYVLQVLKGSPEQGGAVDAILRVYDTEGKDTSREFVFQGSSLTVPLGSHGLSVELVVNAASQLVTGDQFLFAVTGGGASSHSFDGVRLDGAVYDPNKAGNQEFTKIDVHQVYSGEITAVHVANGDPFTAAADEVTLVDLSLPAPTGTGLGRLPFVYGFGDVYLSYRALVLPGVNEGVIEVLDTTDQVQFGDQHPDNDLGYGVARCFEGGGGKRMYALRTEGESADDYTEALTKVESADIYYAFAFLSTEIEVQEVATAHVEAMSQPTVKNFRRCYVGVDSPGDYTYIGQQADLSFFMATTAADTLTVTTGNPLDPPDINFNTNGVSIGDYVNVVGDPNNYVIEAILSATSLRISAPAGESLPVLTIPTSFTIVKPGTTENTALFIKDRATQLTTRRAALVWIEDATTQLTGGIEKISSKYFACEVAGTRAALLPQQGMTRSQLTSATDAPAMYTRYRQSELNDIASGGVLVVAQELEGGDLFIRHQLTTETSNGALQWEDSPGVIVDFVSFQLKDITEGYIGRYNVTQRTLNAIEDDVLLQMNQNTQDTLPNLGDAGPMLISFADENGNEGQVTVRVHDTLKDTIIVYVRARVPLPLNYIDNYVDAEVAEFEISSEFVVTT